MHLTQLHGFADTEVEDDPKFDFKTFGGGIVPVAIMEKEDGTTEAKVILVEFLSKPDRHLISETFVRDGEIWIKTNASVEHRLIAFPDIKVPVGVLTL